MSKQNTIPLTTSNGSFNKLAIYKFYWEILENLLIKRGWKKINRETYRISLVTISATKDFVYIKCRDKKGNDTFSKVSLKLFIEFPDLYIEEFKYKIFDHLL